MPYVQLKELSFAQAGNRKQIRIANETSINWIEKLNEEIFRRHWLEFPTVILQFDLNFFNQRTGLLMDVKLIVYMTDGGMYAIETDTNRVVTTFGSSNDSKIYWLLGGLILNIVHIAIAIKYMAREREVGRILARKQRKEGKADPTKNAGGAPEAEKGNKKGKKSKTADAVEDEEDDLSAMEEDGQQDGNNYRKCKRWCCFAIKFQCFKGSSFMSKVTVFFNVVMFISMIVKNIVTSNVTAEIEDGDMTQEYYDFSSYMITTDVLVFLDLLLYLMLILVLLNVIFKWLP